MLVVTNGCFDILTANHVRLFEFAKSLGDKLIVAMNSDDSIKRLKGQCRPINNESDRVMIVRACRFVDGVVVFHEDTPAELYSKLQPDVLVKGGDYSGQILAGSEYCGKVMFAPRFTSPSTTDIAKRITSL